MVVLSFAAIVFNLNFVPLVFNTKSLVTTLLFKMDMLSASIATWLKWAMLFYFINEYLFITGLTLLVRRLISSIGCLPHFLEVFLSLRFYMVKLFVTSIFILLVAQLIHVYVIMLLIIFLHVAFHAYSWATIFLINRQ